MRTKISLRLGLPLFVLTGALIWFLPVLRETQGTTMPQPIAATPQRMEVVFVLDTTGSMGGLIAAAKEKIFAIAHAMTQADPAPEIAIGLVAYRDRGDDYVTRVTDLSTDIDTVYSTLLDFRASGGGDAPESVNAALYDAVHAISWSDDPAAYRVIFLVGDAPPHMDYDNEHKYPETARLAAGRGIVINAILCGDDAQTESHWREIADLTQGRYFTVGQQGDAVAIDTPYDRRIAELSARLDDTRLYYGSADVLAETSRKVAAADKLNREASAASRARRAAFNLTRSGAKSHYGDDELVRDVADGSVSLAEIAAPELPAVMRPMDASERAAYLKSQTEQRDRLNRELRELVAKRTAFVTTRAEAREGIEASLDHRIFDAVREQAGAKGFRYTDTAPAL